MYGYFNTRDNVDSIDEAQNPGTGSLMPWWQIVPSVSNPIDNQQKYSVYWSTRLTCSINAGVF